MNVVNVFRIFSFHSFAGQCPCYEILITNYIFQFIDPCLNNNGIQHNSKLCVKLTLNTNLKNENQQICFKNQRLKIIMVFKIVKKRKKENKEKSIVDQLLKLYCK